MKKLEGILPAIVTPIDRAGKFNAEAYAQLLTHVYAAGVHGVYVCGQTGEGLQQPAAQRKLVAAASVQLSPPDKIVMIHVGAMNTAEAIDLAEHAAQIGAHAISALPPIGNYSFAEIKAYYQAIASASALPLLIYYFPAFAPVMNSVQQILELCEIPNVHGLKFTDNDLYKMSELKRQGATIFYGTDEMLTAGLVMGADGGIGSFYNVMPQQFVQLYELTRRNEWQQARAVQAIINEVIAIGLRYPVNAAVKAMLQHLGLDCGGCLPPRRSLSAEEVLELKHRLAQTQFWQSL
ncbi:MAG: dihydrodipicolinate synthase family protein [Blastocatellia bacterium]|nr:dihydrodipicolinate synthase family protein [Blastocatellia bacterium]